MTWLVGIILLCTPALAATTPPLGDPIAEARAVTIGDKLRCVVCQSESINDSQATMASDLRQLVRDKIKDGWSDEQIITYARQRYGDFILLSPPVQTNTTLLWLSPALFLCVAAIIGIGFFRRRQPSAGDQA